jgi:hypothetical protein
LRLREGADGEVAVTVLSSEDGGSSGVKCSSSSRSLPVTESLNSRIPRPSERPISGSLFGPKTSKATRSRMAISQIPIPKGTLEA